MKNWLDSVPELAYRILVRREKPLPELTFRWMRVGESFYPSMFFDFDFHIGVTID